MKVGVNVGVNSNSMDIGAIAKKVTRGTFRQIGRCDESRG